MILNDYLKPASSAGNRRREMRILKGSSFVVTLLGMGVAIVMIGGKGVLDSWWKLASVFSGGMLGLFLLGYMGRRLKSGHAKVGVVAGVLVIGWMSLSTLLPEGRWHMLASPFHGYLSIVFGTMTVFGTGFFVSILAGRAKTEPE